MKMNSINTAQKIKFSIKNFFNKCDQVCRELRIWSDLLEKSLIENFIFYAAEIELHRFTSQLSNSFLWMIFLSWFSNYYAHFKQNGRYEHFSKIVRKLRWGKIKKIVLFSCFFNKRKFLLEGGAIAPNAPPQLRQWNFLRIL